VNLPILPNDQRIGRWLASCLSSTDGINNSPAISAGAAPHPDAFTLAGEAQFGMSPSGFEMLNSFRNTACCDAGHPGGGGAATRAFECAAQFLSPFYRCFHSSTAASPASIRLRIEPAFRTACSSAALTRQPVSLDLLRAGDQAAAASLVEQLTAAGWVVVRAGAEFASVMAAAYASMLSLMASPPGAEPCHIISRHHFDEGRYVGFSRDNGRTFISWRQGLEGGGAGCQRQSGNDAYDGTFVASQHWPADAQAQRHDLAAAHEVCSRAAEDILAAILCRAPRHPTTTVESLLRPALAVRSTTIERAAEPVHCAREAAYGSSVQRFLITRDKPPESSPASFSSGQHTDMGLLTLAPLSTHAALEIIDHATGSIVGAEAGLSATLGDCVLLAGETLQFVTGGAVKAAIHRVPWVVRPQAAPPRRSAPYFMRAHPAARLQNPSGQPHVSCRELMELHVASLRPWRLRAFDALNAGDW
jgi:hypothetical protein